jgi:hypothetical protein
MQIFKNYYNNVIKYDLINKFYIYNYNMKKHKSTDYKLSAVEYYLDNDDLSLRDTCDIYKCSKYSLVRWVRRYLKYGTVENKARKEFPMFMAILARKIYSVLV